MYEYSGIKEKPIAFLYLNWYVDYDIVIQWNLTLYYSFLYYLQQSTWMFVAGTKNATEPTIFSSYPFLKKKKWLTSSIDQ